MVVGLEQQAHDGQDDNGKDGDDDAGPGLHRAHERLHDEDGVGDGLGVERGRGRLVGCVGGRVRRRRGGGRRGALVEAGPAADAAAGAVGVSVAEFDAAVHQRGRGVGVAVAVAVAEMRIRV